PSSQELLTNQELAQQRVQSTKSQSVMLHGLLPPGSSDTGIPRVEVANATAEKLFRQTLAVDPSLVEARVRLGRILEVEQHAADAAAELERALSARPSGGDAMVAFYAHLFASRANQALNRGDAAVEHARAALALFPNAQSALLAQSQLALHRSDRD